jgi:uncharacterized oligopeptide transporter (OPT) family protein
MFDTNRRLSWSRKELGRSSAIIGIGMVTGFKIALDAFFGMIFGWAVLPFTGLYVTPAVTIARLLGRGF